METAKKNNIITWLTVLIGLAIFCPIMASALENYEVNPFENKNNTQPVSQSGTILYVDDDNVSGPWDGTFSNPFLTIQEGVDSAQAEDTVMVMPGNYDGAWILASGWDVHPGTDNIVIMGNGDPANIIVANTPMGMATFFSNGTYIEIKSMTITDGDIHGILLSCDSAVIEGNIITNNGNPSECSHHYGMGIRADNQVQKVTIQNNIISANGRSCDDGISGGGIYCEADECHIIDNNISNNFAMGSQSCYGGGIYCASGGTISGNIINGNYTEGHFSYTHPVECYGGGAYLDNSGAASALYFENNTVIGNWCEASGGYQQEVEGKGGGVYCQAGGSIYFENNIIVDNLCENNNFPADSIDLTLEGAGLFCDSTIQSIYANDLWDNVPEDYNSVIYPDPINYNISANPAFCNPDSADYYIYNYSPCAPENSGNGELIGALGVGCSTDVAITVTNLNTSGTGSLAWAIDSANNHPAQNIIEFAVSGVISQSAGLPDLTDPAGTVINGSSAPGKAPSIIVNGGGTLSFGVTITGPNNTIEGVEIRDYFIGINIDGTEAKNNIIINNTIVENYIAGIAITNSANNNQIGGYVQNESNTIIDNNVGIASTADSIWIIGNQIGDIGHGNTYDGINLNGSSYHLIDSNIISYNGEGIVLVNGGAYNTITKNEIFLNDELGIDLNDDGVTANDSLDLDTGPNDLLNFPVIDSMKMNPDSSFTAYYHVDNNGVTVEFFVAHPGGDSTKPVDPSGYGEAYSYIGSDSVDIGNHVYIIPNTVPQFSSVTATMTDNAGNTSEFSPNFIMFPGPLIIVGYSTAKANLINLWVTDPEDFYIGRDSADNPFQNLYPATYTEGVNDSINIPYPKTGTYTVSVVTEEGTAIRTTYEVGIRIDGSHEVTIVADRGTPPPGESDDYDYEVEEDWHYYNGDANRDEIINIFDVTYIIAYLYMSGPAPWPEHAADANCDLVVNIFDVTRLISYLYMEGEEPCLVEE